MRTSTTRIAIVSVLLASALAGVMLTAAAASAAPASSRPTRSSAIPFDLPRYRTSTRFAPAWRDHGRMYWAPAVDEMPVGEEHWGC